MSIADTLDGFFYPTLTLMTDSYNPVMLINYFKIKISLLSLIKIAEDK